MKSTSPFQLIVVTICVVLLLAGIGAFALLGGAFGGSPVGAVTLWGTLDSQAMQNVISTLRQGDKSFDQITYVQKDPTTYESDLVNAIAAGNPPDLFLLPQDDLVQLGNKVEIIPYSAVSQSTYVSSYVDESQLFLTSQGTVALPFAIDPLVMYWNRDLYASAGIASPPTYWSDFLNDAPRLTAFDAAKNISRSAVALGLWSNVDNVKPILSALIMQAGDPIVSLSPQSGQEVPVFGTNPQNLTENPAEAALRFYTDFADPSKTTYSWNNALSDSRSEFVAGVLATYFGFASEYAGLVAANPNLHFSVALLPQAQGENTEITYGNLIGIAIARGSKNPQGALTIAEKLTSATAGAAVSQAFSLPPARRDLISQGQKNPQSAASAVFDQSALISQAWIDPDPSGSDQIFQTMIESVVSGASTPADAVSSASEAFARLFATPGSTSASSQ
ncbi:MAG: extracellular solute-binding protein [Patescibacteria group bacterium]|nr:extracellular solute-binding protein [Patescibacteria group bacterium]